MRILRSGGNPELWLSQFCYKVGLTDRDRNYHELRNLAMAINALGCIDQFNLGASVGIEILFCRLSAIAEALKNGADRPNWNLSGEIERYDEPTAVLPPQRRSEVSRSAKEKLDAASLREKLAHPRASDVDVDLGLADAPSFDRGKGGKDKKKGRSSGAKGSGAP